MLFFSHSKLRENVLLCMSLQHSRMSVDFRIHRVTVALSIRNAVCRKGMSKRIPLKEHREEASSKSWTISIKSCVCAWGSCTRTRANSYDFLAPEAKSSVQTMVTGCLLASNPIVSMSKASICSLLTGALRVGGFDFL